MNAIVTKEVVLIHYSRGVDKCRDQLFLCTLNFSCTHYIGYLAPGGEGIAIYGLYIYLFLFILFYLPHNNSKKYGKRRINEVARRPNGSFHGNVKLDIGF